MFSQNEIDAVLSQAQQAVDTLAQNVGMGDPPRTVALNSDQRSAGLSRTNRNGDKIDRLLKVEVPLVVCVAERRMPLQEILKIAPGMIVEFEQGVDQELSLLVNNRRIGSGNAVKVSEHFGLRINQLGDVRERITSMGQ